MTPWKDMDRRKTYQRRYMKDTWYPKNKAKVLAANRRWRVQIRRRLAAYKAERGCSRCREKHAACLHFHHLDPRSKGFELGRLALWSWTKILDEIEKCEILCANCHAKLHADRK